MLLFLGSLMMACQSNEKAESNSKDTTQTSPQKNAPATSTGNAIKVIGPGEVEVGTLEMIGNEYVARSGGNKFASVTSGAKRSIMLNDGSEIYTVEDRGATGFLIRQTANSRVLWNVVLSDNGYTLNNDYIPGPIMIRNNGDQAARVVYQNQQLSDLKYESGIHFVSTPQGSIRVEGEPFSYAYGVLGTGFTVAPPFQMLILAELKKRNY